MMESSIIDRPKATDVIFEPGEVGAVLEVTVSAGNNVVEYRRLKSKSFVRQFLDLMYAFAANSSVDNPAVLLTFSVRDTGNVLRRVHTASSVLATNAGVGAATWGIVVGTGSTTPTITDYKLEAPIAHGTGVGQLQFSAVGYSVVTTDGTLSSFRLVRSFSNASGGLVTVREIGIVAGDGTNFYLIIRDVIVPANIPDGQVLTVNYQIVVSI